MKPTFQKEWHGITLSSISNGDSNKLPDKYFYSNFYTEFFRKHHSWADLNQDWVAHKINIARFILSRLPRQGRVLSIGCGLGFIEKFLLDSGALALEIQEISEAPLRWVRPIFPPDAVHVGAFPGSLNSSDKFDYIYIAVVDYCFSQNEWINFLKLVREHLNAESRCLIITPTLHLSDYSCSEFFLRIKAGIKHFLSFFGIYDLGQMMGWRRSRKDFMEAMTRAGFEFLDEGFLDKDALMPRTFWIEGSIVHLQK